MIGGNITGRYPVDFDYYDKESKICIVNAGDEELTFNLNGDEDIFYLEPYSEGDYGLLQISDDVYNQLRTDTLKNEFVKDSISGSYVSKNTDLEEYRDDLVEEPVDYTVTYVNAEGAENMDLNPTTVCSLKTYKLVDIKKQYYVFKGWYTDSAFTNQVTEISKPKGDVTLYAKFVKISLDPVTVTYESASKGIQLSWTKSENADGYCVYRASGNGAYTLLKKTTSTTYTDTSVKNNGVYRYQVTPYCGNMSGAASKESTFRYCGSKVKLSVSSIASGKKLKMTALQLSGVKYEIYRSAKGGSFKKIKTLASSNSVWTDTSAKSNVEYAYYVKEISADKYSLMAPNAKSNTAYGYYLAAPTIKSVKNSASKSMTVKYGKKSGVTGYEILYSTNKKFNSAKKVTVKKAATVKKTIKNLKKGKTYYIKVRTYKTISGRSYVSGWSKIKKVKISK